MIAVDTNVIVYSHRQDTTFHDAAVRRLKQLSESAVEWAIPWPCLHEFLAVATGSRVFKPPSALDIALRHLDALLESPSLVLIGEDSGYWPKLRRLLTSTRTVGARVHDARIAAICLRHEIDTLWSADRDFGRFPGLKVVNPLVAS